jgi:uncharacterized hydrophobic protein (TIGR00271 family)
LKGFSENFKFAWHRLTADWRPYIEQPVSKEDMNLAMRQGSIPTFGFFLLLITSTAIATFGLLSNSAPAIIGAMIIAPLMTPIISFSSGLSIANYARIVRSLLTIVSGVMVVITLSFILTKSIGIGIATPEIMARVEPSLLDLGVAVAAGLSAAFAHSRKSVMNSVAGVAIAVALVPPLAVVGIGLAMGPMPGSDLSYSLQEAGLREENSSIAGGAFLLFLINLVAIIISAGFVMICQGYGSVKKGTVGLIMMAVMLLVMLEPLEESLERIYIKSLTLKYAGQLVRSQPNMRPTRGWIESLHVRYIDNRLYVFIKGVLPKEDLEGSQAMIVRLQRKMSSELGKPVIFQLTAIQVDLTTVTVGSKQAIISTDQ